MGGLDEHDKIANAIGKGIAIRRVREEHWKYYVLISDAAYAKIDSEFAGFRGGIHHKSCKKVKATVTPVDITDVRDIWEFHRDFDDGRNPEICPRCTETLIREVIEGFPIHLVYFTRLLGMENIYWMLVSYPPDSPTMSRLRELTSTFAMMTGLDPENWTYQEPDMERVYPDAKIDAAEAEMAILVQGDAELGANDTTVAMLDDGNSMPIDVVINPPFFEDASVCSSNVVEILSKLRQGKLEPPVDGADVPGHEGTKRLLQMYEDWRLVKILDPSATPLSPQVIGIVHEYLCHVSLSPYLERGPKPPRLEIIKCKAPCEFRYPPFPTIVCDNCSYLDFTRWNSYTVAQKGWDQYDLKVRSWHAWGKLWRAANYPEDHYRNFSAMYLDRELRKGSAGRKRRREEDEEE
jgi:hypothetical protein